MAMSWVERFAKNVAAFAGEAVRTEVMQGSEALGDRPTPGRRARWIKSAMDRLDALVDEDIRKQIMIRTCPHTYPKQRIATLRKQYRQLGSLDKLLDLMYRDTSYGGTSYYDCPQRKGNVIYITKVPCRPKAHATAQTDLERRLTYCHCPWARAALKTKEPVSATFCYCSAAWDKQLWEGILERPVKIEIVESLLKGDRRCVHAFQLPPGVH